MAAPARSGDVPTPQAARQLWQQRVQAAPRWSDVVDVESSDSGPQEELERLRQQVVDLQERVQKLEALTAAQYIHDQSGDTGATGVAAAHKDALLFDAGSNTIICTAAINLAGHQPKPAPQCTDSDMRSPARIVHVAHGLFSFRWQECDPLQRSHHAREESISCRLENPRLAVWMTEGRPRGRRAFLCPHAVSFSVAKRRRERAVGPLRPPSGDRPCILRRLPRVLAQWPTA